MAAVGLPKYFINRFKAMNKVFGLPHTASTLLDDVTWYGLSTPACLLDSGLVRMSKNLRVNLNEILHLVGTTAYSGLSKNWSVFGVKVTKFEDTSSNCKSPICNFLTANKSVSSGEWQRNVQQNFVSAGCRLGDWASKHALSKCPPVCICIYVQHIQHKLAFKRES